MDDGDSKRPRIALIGPHMVCDVAGEAAVGAGAAGAAGLGASGCAARDAMLGSYTLDDGLVSVPLLPAQLNASFPGLPYSVSPGCAIDGSDPRLDLIPAAVAAAAAADYAIVAVGDSLASCGEWADRDSLDLPGGQLALLAALAANTTTPLIVVLINGRAPSFGPGNALLARFGMANLVRAGGGKIEGTMAWAGAPLNLDYPSLSGRFNMDIGKGQFLRADPGVARLLGVLSLQSLPRRLLLDFRDVFSDGFEFNYVRGDVTTEQGIARSDNLQMKGAVAAVLMDGSTDIARETQKIKVLVIPELDTGAATLLTALANPIAGLYTLVASTLLRQPLQDASTQELLVEGTWQAPKVSKIDRRTGKPIP